VNRQGLSALWADRAGRVALLAVLALAAATVAGLAVLWPRAEAPVLPGAGLDVERATVLAVTTEGCPADASPGCRILRVRMQSGEQAGAETTATLAGDAFTPPVDPGDTIRVVPAFPAGAGQEPLATGVQEPWVFTDFERRMPMLWLAVAFGLLVVLLARLRGALALAGLGVGFLLLVSFVVPAILEGRSPLAVAIVGAVAVLLVTLALAHGPGVTSVAAALGAAATLGLTAVLALLLVDAAHLTGFVSDQAVMLRGVAPGGLSPQGLLIAGVVIAALGVLDDVAVSQASTVVALRAAAPGTSARELYRRAIRVGRDHLAAVVNTLALAYAGASLPVLLAFSAQRASFGEAINREIVAQEVVALLVGSVGIVAAVPLTTAIAVALVRRLPTAVLEREHGHAH
jgi:uncharacterized membrane protein